MGWISAESFAPVDTDVLLLAMLAWALLGGLLYLRLSRSRARIRHRLSDAVSQLDRLRGRDPLTGLVTRPEFELALEEAALECDRSGAPLAVFYLGLDNFHDFNETYGLRVGDELLVQVARRLTSLVGSGPVVCRLTGDEFAMLVPGDADEAGRTATQLCSALQQPFEPVGMALLVTASVGIAMYPDHGSRPRLLAHAALAMRSVKQVGGASHGLYDPAMGVDQRNQAELVHDLRLAIEHGQLELYYQPKIDAHSLQITAAEALLRWQHPRRGMVSPTVFIPLAERHGLIGVLGNWVIAEACRQAGLWREQGLRMRMAVNLSGLQLRQDDLVQRIEAALRRHGIPAERLTCEITESVAMEDTTQTRAAFERLRLLGVHVSIDDFGTGHSSLAFLRRLPAAELKIDRAFVTDLANSAEARSIAKAIVQMAHTLELRVVAEGVETEAQRDILLELQCDELQGFLFAKPMPAFTLALWASDDRGDNGLGQAAAFRSSLFDPTAPAQLADTSARPAGV
jgi:diguanylate cyclase (GGDEF)-like protein